MYQVKKISVGVFEEGKTVSLHFIRLSFELNTMFPEVLISGIEVIDRDGNMAKARRPHARFGPVAFSRYDLDQRSIFCLDEVVAGVFECDFEFERSNVEVRQPFWIGGGNSEMLDP